MCFVFVVRGYGHLTKQLVEVSPEGKVVLVLEGGYDLEAISTSFAECVRVLKAPLESTKRSAFVRAQEGGGSCSDSNAYLPAAYGGPLVPSPTALRAVRATIRRHLRYWPCLRPRLRGTDSLDSYATRPCLLSRIPFRPVAFTFNGPSFAGRLSRFSARRWRRLEFRFQDAESFDDDVSISDSSESYYGSSAEQDHADSSDEVEVESKRLPEYSNPAIRLQSKRAFDGGDQMKAKKARSSCT